MAQSFDFYLLFHLNLAFSSIEEEDRGDVIDRCYRPLIELMEKSNFIIGVEATGYTLEEIQRLRPDLMVRLKTLAQSGKCDFIASAYTQMIAPLVPYDVTEWNLKLGLEVVERLLGIKPKLVLVNEQAYSPSLIPLYKKVGFEGMVMDWAEPASYNENWTHETRFLPQVVEGAKGECLPVVWSDAISFQKFQRVVHGELTFDEYQEYLFTDKAMEKVAIPLYASDGEVFDYRPGRFNNEADVQDFSEWDRVNEMLIFVAAMPNSRIVSPSSVLSLLKQDATPVTLETPACPVPVKKQRKYNLLRWGVTGRDDLSINTACYRLYDQFKSQNITDREEWRELCYLWSSDFRTHITEKRWKAYCERLERKLIQYKPVMSKQMTYPDTIDLGGFDISEEGRFLTIKSNVAEVCLNLARGGAIESFKLINDEKSWIGTLQLGYYDHIGWGADFYSAHMVVEQLGMHKITDLVKVEPDCSLSDDNKVMWLTSEIQTGNGVVIKKLGIERDIPRILMEYDFSGWSWPVKGALRLGYAALNPEMFDEGSLFFATHNGGDELEEYSLKNSAEFDHAEVVSLLISARTGLGLTKGGFYFGDKNRKILIKSDRSQGALLGQINYQNIKDSFFCRASLSARENDDTNRGVSETKDSFQCNRFSFSYELLYR